MALTSHANLVSQGLSLVSLSFHNKNLCSTQFGKHRGTIELKVSDNDACSCCHKIFGGNGTHDKNCGNSKVENLPEKRKVVGW